jgi:prenyltransferase beta subunit
MLAFSDSSSYNRYIKKQHVVYKAINFLLIRLSAQHVVYWESLKTYLVKKNQMVNATAKNCQKLLKTADTTHA